jgi:hypothetical protein
MRREPASDGGLATPEAAKIISMFAGEDVGAAL